MCTVEPIRRLIGHTVLGAALAESNLPGHFTGDAQQQTHKVNFTHLCTLLLVKHYS